MYSENIYQSKYLECHDGKEVENKPDKKIIVELGPGLCPLLSLSTFPDIQNYDSKQHKAGRPMILKDNEVYIGIEPGRHQVNDARSALDLSSEYIKGRVQIVQGLGEHLPIKENTVDQVFIRNLFTDPSFYDVFPLTLKNENKYIKERIKPIIKELRRIVKKGGKVIIAEVYTPRVCKSEYIIEVFIENGFLLSKNIQFDNDTNFSKALRDIAKFKSNIIINKEGNYILEFERAD
ncbi:MAG: methyltransferase domain-containing protein [Candidatus Jacksonbacteria bacterium]